MTTGRTMEAIHKEGIHKMTLPERQALEKELKDLTIQLQGGDAQQSRGDGRSDGGDPTVSRPDLLQNKPALLARKRKLEELLNKDDDLVATGNQRSLLSAEAKAIEDRIAKHMLTERERMYRAGQRPQDYETAVQKTVYQQREHLKDIQRWQEIMRQLEPNDPTACDVRRIKPR